MSKPIFINDSFREETFNLSDVSYFDFSSNSCYVYLKNGNNFEVKEQYRIEKIKELIEII